MWAAAAKYSNSSPGILTTHELVDASPHAGSEGGLEVAPAAQMRTILEPVPLEVVHFFVHAVALVARINHPGHQIGTRPEERGHRRYATPEANELRGHHVQLEGRACVQDTGEVFDVCPV